jgi:hypothetical protein
MNKKTTLPIILLTAFSQITFAQQPNLLSPQMIPSRAISKL